MTDAIMKQPETVSEPMLFFGVARISDPSHIAAATAALTKQPEHRTVLLFLFYQQACFTRSRVAAAASSVKTAVSNDRCSLKK